MTQEDFVRRIGVDQGHFALNCSGIRKSAEWLLSVKEQPIEPFRNVTVGMLVA
jgi:hypothetical protein